MLACRAVHAVIAVSSPKVKCWRVAAAASTACGHAIQETVSPCCAAPSPSPPPPRCLQPVALVPAPAACDSWKAWAAGVKAAAEGEPAGQKHTAAGVRAALQASLQQLEEALIGESVGGLAADGDDEGSEEAGGTEGADEAEEGSGEGGRSREQVGRRPSLGGVRGRVAFAGRCCIASHRHAVCHLPGCAACQILHASGLPNTAVQSGVSPARDCSD